MAADGERGDSGQSRVCACEDLETVTACAQENACGIHGKRQKRNPDMDVGESQGDMGRVRHAECAPKACSNVLRHGCALLCAQAEGSKGYVMLLARSATAPCSQGVHGGAALRFRGSLRAHSPRGPSGPVGCVVGAHVTASRGLVRRRIAAIAHL